MSGQKQLRVSEAVHNELERRKSGDQTYDDVMREVLDLVPDLEQLLAYLGDEQGQMGRRIIMQIEGVGDLERSIEEEPTSHVVSFTSTDSERVIAELEIDENPARAEFTVRYKAQRGNMEPIGTVKESENGVEGGILGGTGRFDDPEEYVDAVRRNVERAYESWG